MSVGIILFIESLTQEHIRYERAGVMTFILGVYTVSFFDNGVVEQKNIVYNLWDYSKSNNAILLSFLAVIGFIIITVWTISGFNKPLKVATTNHNRKLVWFMIIGFIMAGLLTGISTEIAFSLPITDPAVQAIAAGIIPNIFMVIGTLMLMLPYVTSRDMRFLVPQNYYDLLVINDNGLLLWNYQFDETCKSGSITKKDCEDNSNAHLLSGALTAVSQLIKESTGISSSLKVIKFEDRTFSVCSYESIAVVLISDRSSDFISNALKEFIESFWNRFMKVIDISQPMDLNDFASADELLTDTLGLNND